MPKVQLPTPRSIVTYVPEPRIVGGMMFFDRLDNCDNTRGILTVAWKIEDDDDDPWTRRIASFKQGSPQAVNGAKRVLTAALGGIDLEARRVGLTVALGHADTSLNPDSPLAAVGQHLAATLGFTWLPDILQKERHRPLHRLQGFAERDAEVQGKYQARRLTSLDKVLILDDRITRGSTIADITRAIGAATRKRIPTIGVAIGKTERREYAAQHDVIVSNDHVPEEWARMWDECG